MSWELLIVLVPFVLFFVVLRRVIRVVQTFRNPEKLRALLSPQVRQALLDGGVDPDAVTMQELQDDPKLLGIVSKDIQAALRREVVGGVFGGRSRSDASYRPPSLGFDSERPPPIDAGGGIGPRVVLVLVGVALLAGIAFFLGLGR